MEGRLQEAGVTSVHMAMAARRAAGNLGVAAYVRGTSGSEAFVADLPESAVALVLLNMHEEALRVRIDLAADRLRGAPACPRERFAL
jgi:hypothetical protein